MPTKFWLRLSQIRSLRFVTQGSAQSGWTEPPLKAFAPESRILFQGDSITDGNRGRSADPTDSGHQLLADAWLKTVRKWWKR